MTRTQFQLQAIGDPRLAAHVTSTHPAWLWSIDGRHVLWANPVAVRATGFHSGESVRITVKAGHRSAYSSARADSDGRFTATVRGIALVRSNG